jgi:hypothetical protein
VSYLVSYAVPRRKRIFFLFKFVLCFGLFGVRMRAYPCVVCIYICVWGVCVWYINMFVCDGM